jgi:hypothetical protein
MLLARPSRQAKVIEFGFTAILVQFSRRLLCCSKTLVAGGSSSSKQQ